jgi:lipoyl(octanoyl) transferase
VTFRLPVIDLGRLPYEPAYQTQLTYLEEVLAAREAGEPVPGYLLLVEHDPVITISRRAGASNHLLATPEMLRQQGVTVAETDRGGDITYHGPGQLVAYPILDLNLLNLGLHEYMRLLEQSVIDTCAGYGLETFRDPAATGVWMNSAHHPTPAKIAAMGVRVRRWVSLHGLALNVTTNLDHFKLIVPCGLAGRPVTSMHAELSSACPAFDTVKRDLAQHLTRHLQAAAEEAAAARRAAAT